MKRREMTLKVIRRQYDKYVPYCFSLSPNQQRKFYEEFYEWDYQNLFSLPYQYVEFKYNGNNDDWYKYFEDQEILNEHYFDEFGVGRSKSDYFNLYALRSPLKTAGVSDLETYPFPKIDQYSWTETKIHSNEIKSKDAVSVGFLAMTIFELAWTMRGYKRLLKDLNNETDFFYALIDKITEIRVEQAKKMAEIGIDVIHLGDDVADKNGMLFDVKLWRKIFKPRLQKIITEARKVNSKVLIEYHGEGNVECIIPDLIEIGVDMLNPVEPESVDAIYLKEKYGKDLSFRGGLSVVDTLPYGTKEEVEEKCLTLLRKMSNGGGYIMSPAHSIRTNVPWENFETFLATTKKYNKSLKKNS